MVSLRVGADWTSLCRGTQDWLKRRREASNPQNQSPSHSSQFAYTPHVPRRLSGAAPVGWSLWSSFPAVLSWAGLGRGCSPSPSSGLRHCASHSQHREVHLKCSGCWNHSSHEVRRAVWTQCAQSGT